MADQLPEWVLNPTDPNAAAAMAADLTRAVASRHIDAVLDEHPEADPAEFAATMRFRSEVAFDVMRLTAENQALADRSLNEQAVVAMREQLHLHHPNEYETAQQYFQDALADTHRSVSEASDMRFYAETVLPHMREKNIAGAEKLWVKGENVKKARAAKPALNKAFKQLAQAKKLGDETASRQVEQIIYNILDNVINPNVTADGVLGEHPGGNRSDMRPLQAFKYLRGDGTIMVLIAMDESQRIFAEEALGKFADWHLGSGYEEVVQASISSKGD